MLYFLFYLSLILQASRIGKTKPRQIEKQQPRRLKRSVRRGSAAARINTVKKNPIRIPILLRNYTDKYLLSIWVSIRENIGNAKRRMLPNKLIV